MRLRLLGAWVAEGKASFGHQTHCSACWPPHTIAAELRPAVVFEYERALHAIFTAGAEKRRRLREAAAAALDAAYER